ncbi:hypothetical protein CAter282_1999 [Collimonas arenae]|uniref:DUF2239 family protein n=1 Tax=Collimonas arenae TaxID=279058 RepID=A0A127PQ15_9BURK|nr:DUF2239 family protein [Collimonas arenae]AMO99862.1 hypothetical protein CAter10_2169 [Collimonas arenae]AMP09762.1 hypothetical protein CAter282_1999 [Collimonas arenae]
MHSPYPNQVIAFAGAHRIASGQLALVALKAKELLDRNDAATVLIFDDITSAQVEVDFRGSAEQVLQRLSSNEIHAAQTAKTVNSEELPRGPGRPKLGVIGREVTLLPRHWDWLNQQPGGASVALRKLVEDAKRQGEERDQIRRAQEYAYRFMSAMAGDLINFEEATRAFFAGDQERFAELSEPWQIDIRDHARRLAARAFAVEA